MVTVGVLAVLVVVWCSGRLGVRSSTNSGNSSVLAELRSNASQCQAMPGNASRMPCQLNAWTWGVQLNEN
jgi:hypothetical protein